jgi:hypothetical protein
MPIFVILHNLCSIVTQMINVNRQLMYIDSGEFIPSVKFFDLCKICTCSYPSVYYFIDANGGLYYNTTILNDNFVVIDTQLKIIDISASGYALSSNCDLYKLTGPNLVSVAIRNVQTIYDNGIIKNTDGSMYHTSFLNNIIVCDTSIVRHIQINNIGTFYVIASASGLMIGTLDVGCNLRIKKYNGRGLFGNAKEYIINGDYNDGTLFKYYSDEKVTTLVPAIKISDCNYYYIKDDHVYSSATDAEIKSLYGCKTSMLKPSRVKKARFINK